MSSESKKRNYYLVSFQQKISTNYLFGLLFFLDFILLEDRSCFLARCTFFETSASLPPFFFLALLCTKRCSGVILVLSSLYPFIRCASAYDKTNINISTVINN